MGLELPFELLGGVFSDVYGLCRAAVGSHEGLLRVTNVGGGGSKASGVLVFADHTDRDRHIGMVLAAELGTLAVVETFTLSLEPGFVQATRNSVDLHTESRHGESVDDVGCGDENANGLAN